MFEQHVLVADDDRCKREYLASLTRASVPKRAQVHVVDSVRAALAVVGRFGSKITDAIIDYDFIPERKSGDEIIAALRRTNSRARIVLATARAEGGSFEEAEWYARSAGADEALSTESDSFESRFSFSLN